MTRVRARPVPGMGISGQPSSWSTEERWVSAAGKKATGQSTPTPGRVPLPPSSPHEHAVALHSAFQTLLCSLSVIPIPGQGDLERQQPGSDLDFDPVAPRMITNNCIRVTLSC